VTNDDGTLETSENRVSKRFVHWRKKTLEITYLISPKVKLVRPTHTGYLNLAFVKNSYSGRRSMSKQLTL